MAIAYEITVEFTGGILVGLSHVRRSTKPMAVGTVVKRPVGNTSPYKVVSCVELTEEQLRRELREKEIKAIARGR